MSGRSFNLRCNDDRLEARVMDVWLNGRRLETPLKTVESPGNRNDLVETMPRITAASVERSIETGKPLGNVVGPGSKSDCPRVVIPNYLDQSISDNVLRHLENNVHPHSDIVVVPRWDGVLRNNRTGALLDDIWAMSSRYLEEVRRLNGKPVLGNIPLNRPQNFIDALVERYIDVDVSSFVLDFEGCQVPGRLHALRGIRKILSDHGCLEGAVLYSTNVRSYHETKDIRPADDFLVFMMGVDILGNYHLRGGGDSTKVKVFDRGCWTYDWTSDVAASDLVKGSNHRAINLEAEIVRAQITETGTVVTLARKKPGAREYTSSASQTTLDLHGIRWGSRSPVHKMPAKG